MQHNPNRRPSRHPRSRPTHLHRRDTRRPKCARIFQLKTDTDPGIPASRMRRDLQPFRQRDEITVDPRLLYARRTDSSINRNRALARLRTTLLEYFPALEARFQIRSPPRRLATVRLRKKVTKDRALAQPDRRWPTS